MEETKLKNQINSQFIIRLLQDCDLETRVIWMNSPIIYKSMHYELPITISRTREWFENNIGNNKRADLVLCDANGEIVAFSGIIKIDPTLRKGELYTFVNPYEHHKGIGTIAKQLTLEYAFKNLNLNKVYSVVNEDNVPSYRINEKLGFQLEGRLRQEDINKDGKFRDRLYYGILKSEYFLD